VALSASTGAAAAGLVTGADVKNGSLTGADVKNGSITNKDLAMAPRTWVWTAHYTGDGTRRLARVTSAKAVPVGVTVRGFKISFTGATNYCVAHGNADDPSLNTGWIQVGATVGSSSQIATYHTAADLTPTIHVDALGNGLPTAFFVARSGTHLALTAQCLDATGQTAADVPMQDFTVKVTFQTTPVSLRSPRAFS
jgi:hypothetical protein